MRTLAYATMLLGTAALLLVSAACSGDGGQYPNGQAQALATAVAQFKEAGKSGGAIVDWVKSYDDIPSLAADADLIAVGHVTGIAPNDYQPSHGGGTILDVMLGRVLKGSAAEGDTIHVGNAGAIGPDWSFEKVINDPPFVKGIDYLLFLARPEEGAYYVIGGPDGRFVIEDGHIQALSIAYGDPNFEDTGESGLTLDEVAAIVGNAAGEAPTNEPSAIR
jgi:hypothetical protein